MIARRGLLATVVISLGLSAAPALAAAPSWTTYRRDAVRSGVDPGSSSPVAPAQAWQTSPPLDGAIYGEPLVYGSRVFVATENDTVYALDAATGTVVWAKHLATAVPAGDLPCGDIQPVVGITSTPVIDPSNGTIYVVADTWDGSRTTSIHHELFGLAIADGAFTAGLPTAVDPPGSTPTAQLQRAALALDGGRVIIGYGGNDGDCGQYHGWLVGAPEGGGPLDAFEVGAGGKGGAIWGAGNGPAVDSSGNIWASTGNGVSSTFGDQESVLKLDPNLGLLDYWAPSNWPTLDSSDADLGSSAPVLLPGGLVFQIGKEGVGYLLSASKLGGVGGAPLYQSSVCGGSWGGAVYSGGIIYVTCDDGLHALSLNASNQTFAPLSSWNVNAHAIGPPIVAGGLVWSADYNGGTLYGLDPQTGATRFSVNLGTFEHFASASAAGGRLFIANGNRVTSFTIATPPAPAATSTVLASSQNPSAAGRPVTFTATVSPAPDAGTVAFTDDGVPIPGCSAVGVVVASGRASCTTSYGHPATHTILAAYSGDSYYAGSSSQALSQVVQASSGGSGGSGGSVRLPPRFSHVRVKLSHGRLQLRLTLSENATIAVTLGKTVRGRLVGRRCRAGGRTGHRCRASVTVRTLKLRGRRGNDLFTLRIKVLRPGRYTLSLIARDLAGRRSRRIVVSFAVPARRR